jgi:hypothetical protein
LKEAAEHELFVNLKSFVKHLPNTCLVENPSDLKIFGCSRAFLLEAIPSGAVLSRCGQ